MSITTKGTWKQIRELPYEMNQSGMVRSTKNHPKGEGIYVKPTMFQNAKPRYVFRVGVSDSHPFSIIVNQLLQEVWGEDRFLTETEVHYIRKIAEQKNRESNNHEKQEPPKKKQIKAGDKPLIVNNKFRYCIYCGHILYQSDKNYFYHSSCYRSRNDERPEEIMPGSHSYE